MRLFLTLLLLGSLTLSAQAANKANTVVLRPGEVIYARFETQGKKIKLAGASKEKDDNAQVIFTLKREAETLVIKLKVENKFARDFVYEARIRSNRLARESRVEVMPVVGGKLAIEELSPLTDELTLSGFKLEQ